MFADLIFNLNENESYDSNLSLKIQKTSNSTYFRVHDINTALVDSENTDLKNEIKYSFSKDDVYLDVRIDEIKKMYGDITKKRGWATISLIFDKKEGKNFVFPDAEIIFSSEKIIRYLVNEKKLFATLRLLVNHYNMI